MISGSVQKKGKSYYVVYRINGKQKWKNLQIPTTRGNKRKADKAASEFLRQLEEHSQTENVEFIQYMNGWLKKIEGIIKPSTYETYEITVKKKLIPYFENKKYYLSDLSPNIFTEYFKYLKNAGKRNGKGLSEKSVKNIKGVLSVMLEDACTDKLINENPITASRMPTFENNIKKREVTLSPNEVKKLLDTAKESESHIYVFILLALFTGLRRGELHALTWDDVDFNRKLLIVNKSRTGTSSKVTKQITTPKTKSSNRIIPLADEVVNALIAEKKRQEEYKNFFGNCYDCNNNFIIRTIDGTPYKNLSAINRVVSRLCEKAGIKHCTIHGFRHTVASLLDSEGVPLQEISTLLGHENVNTTERIYIHRSRTAKRENIVVLENVINNN